jgi:hypothetical protein
VQRGTRAAGGFLDIIHDWINAELKVAKTAAVTVETSHKYLGQAAGYAADTGSQLSILVVLDMTKTKNPPWVLENYLGFMKPALAGLDDPRFPSLVGVIIIKGSLLTPSGYSRGTGGTASPIQPWPFPAGRPQAQRDWQVEAAVAVVGVLPPHATDQRQRHRCRLPLGCQAGHGIKRLETVPRA